MPSAKGRSAGSAGEMLYRSVNSSTPSSGLLPRPIKSHRIEKHLPRADRQGDTSLLQSLQLRHQLTLMLFPWVGIAPPYHFTEKLVGVGDCVLPGVIICTGSFLNWRYTKRLLLIAARL